MSRPGSRWYAGSAAVVAVAVLLAWAMARPVLPVALTTVRAAADIAAVVALGLSIVPLLEEGRRRGELFERARRPLIVVGAVWLTAELSQLAVLAAGAAGTGAGSLTLATTVRFAVQTPTGRAALCGIAAAGALAVAAAVRAGPVRDRCAMTAAAAGVAARTVTGHVSGGVVAGVAVVGHALAAAVWCGTLAALVLTVSSRGQWARLLPVFSRWALWCVVAVLVAGSVAAVASIESPAQLYTTGHGRILLAKVAVTGALLGVAWRNRTRWLEAAQRHRVGAGESVRRAVVELSLMAMVLTLAAALSVTG